MAKTAPAAASVMVALFCLSTVSPQARAAQAMLAGHVVDEDGSPVRDTHITIHASQAGAAVLETQSDPTGAFEISLPEAGDYLLSADRQGFYPLRDQIVHVAAPSQELTVTLHAVREVFQSVNVSEQTSPIEVSGTTHEERLTGTEINTIPYANSHSFAESLHLLPEVMQDTTGAPHLNGATQNQVLYLLNGFNLTDPINGQFTTALAVEGIRSVDVSSGRYSPEYGQGSAGVIAINTASGTDRFHYTATDFIPGLSFQQGAHLGNWYPRAGVSGPILRGRAWFSDMASFEYTQSLVTGLPSNANTRSGLLVSNVLHTQFNLTSSNIVYADFMINADNEGRVGLGPLNPVSTTSTVDTRQYLGGVKDQISFSRGALVEIGYARDAFSVNQTPQGQQLYLFSPQGNSGNYFVNGHQTAARDQIPIHAYLPHFHFLGEHQVETGADGDIEHYYGDFHRSGYSVVGLSGQLLEQTLFGPPANFTVTDATAGWWALDTWHALKNLQFTPGLRWDWDQQIGRSAWSPRVGVSWSPFHDDRTRLSGGYSITRDAVTLDWFGFPLDQVATTTTYGSNGAPTGPAVATRFVAANTNLAMPRASNWNLDFNHELTPRILLSASYLRRRGTGELNYANAADPYAPPSLLPIPAGTSVGTYQLTSLRRDDFDSFRVSVRQKLSGQFEWMLAYTRSRALTNALIDFSGAEPSQLLPYLAPMPWDAPNRVLGWAYFPLPWKNWAISALGDMRSGFPYSVRDQYGLVQGPVNAFRYPLNFDLNLAIERMVTFHGYRFALRGGVDNLTDQLNATAVNNVLGVQNFRTFLGAEGRHFVVRIRFFGKAENTGGPRPKPQNAPPLTPTPSTQPQRGESKSQPTPPPVLAPTAPPEAQPEEDKSPPTAGIFGNTGLWKVFTADTLAPHRVVVSTWYDRINRNPGDLVISTAGFGGAIGLTSRMELGVSFEANRDVTTGQLDQLSFGQEALGFFGAKTPGSKPLPSELMPGSSLVPQLRWPPGRNGALTGAAGYFNLFPFAGLVPSGGAAGDFLFGLKVKLLSQETGAPFSLAVRPYFDLPIHKAVTFLETHPIGTADLQGGGDGILSRSIGDMAELFLNAGYRYISQPAHISIFHLRSDVPLGFGLAIPRSARLQLIAESTADVFVGAHTPNTTFGPEDPVDLAVGFRATLWRGFSFSGGYRRPLNQFGGDKNGFVISLGFLAK